MSEENLDLVHGLTFADVHERYTEEEAREIYNELFLEENFSNADIHLLTGGPNELEESQRRENLVEYLSEFDEDRTSLPIVISTDSQREGLLNDERVAEDDYIFHRMDPNSSMEEINSLKSSLEPGDSFTVFTNDYHVPRYEKALNSAIDDSHDYLIFGAEFESEESRYAGKWRSEAFREAIPQKLKDLGKKYILN